MFEDKIFGGAIPQQFIPSIEKGIVKTMAEGVLSGNPMVDIKVTLRRREVPHGRLLRHGVPDRGLARAEGGGRGGGRRAARAGRGAQVVVPDAFTGDVMGDLNAKRGKIAGHGADRRRQAADQRAACRRPRSRAT